MFTLPNLPYDFGALEPYIDARTMEIHHGKHHKAYVDNLNKALEGAPALQGRNIEEIARNLASAPEEVRTAIRNNGGGHYNHSLFWKIMSPKGGGEPTGVLLDKINKAFGSFTSFKEKFSKAALTRFGSGWSWLSVDVAGGLVVTSTPNQDNPAMEGLRPIFGLDVWEHAYYLQYQNRRADYVEAFWNVVNWEEVNRNLKAVA
ncbi:MAG: sodA [Deltaproteobacteria bacterium]|jgi:Fe-Mn family superoxide dismutase|nr:sodA [Deltaproteobacteria bacterium]